MSIYILQNFFEPRQNFIFFENLNEKLNIIINKIKDNLISQIEYDLLKTNYKTIPKKDKLTEFSNIFINSVYYYSILDFNNLIHILLDIPNEFQLLWIENTKLDEKIKNGIINTYIKQERELDVDFTKINQILGFYYKNDDYINYFNPKLNELTELELLNLQLNSEYKLKDTSHQLLNTLNIEPNNIIYYIDFRIF